MKDIDYVNLYARGLLADHTLFVQQKRLIESQLQGCPSLFKESQIGCQILSE